MPTAAITDTTFTRPSAASRRSLFGAGACLLAGGVALAAAANDQSDTALQDLVKRMDRSWKIADAVAAEPLPPGQTLESEDQERRLDEALDDWWDIVDQIADHPARSMAGLRAKAEALQRLLICSVFTAAGQTTAEQLSAAKPDLRLTWSLAADLLAGGALT